MTAMDRAIVLPWWRRKPAVIGGSLVGGLALASLAAAAVLANVEPTLRVPAARVRIETVAPGVLHDFTPLRAKVTPKDIVVLDAQEGGRVEEIMARAGDLVREGQPLIRFRNPELEQQILSQQSGLVNSIAQLQSYAKQLEDTRVANQRQTADIAYNILGLERDLQQAEYLIERGFGRRDVRDRHRDALQHYRNLETLQADSNRRQDELRARELPRIAAEFETLNESLKLTRAKLDGLIVRAPVAGLLTDIDLMIGQMQGRAARLGQITPQTGYKLVAAVDEYYLGRVQPGQAARMTKGEMTIEARVTRVDPQVKDGVFTIELGFEGVSPQGLLTGQTLDGRLSLGGDRQALILPAGPFLEATGGDWVMRLDAGGKTAHRRRIKLGRRNAEQVEVLSGLTAGDRVITSNYDSYDRIERINLAD